MKKKTILLFITCISLILSLFIIGKSLFDRYFITGDLKVREETIVDIMWYLEEKGYTKSDIQETKPFFDSKQTQYGVLVKFKDEPDT